jgi:hypothetical protein
MAIKQNFIHLFIFLLVTLGCSNNANQRVIISFETIPTLQKEAELIHVIHNYLPTSQLSKYLNQQNWIDTFLIKRYAFAPLEIFIMSKEPKYIWNDKFYLDNELSKFLYDGGHPELIKLFMPIEYTKKWNNTEEKFLILFESSNFNIKSINFNPAEGRFIFMNNNLRINLGDQLSSDIYQRLSLTLKYLLENNLTPSIIDLRYKDGAALNYGK